MHMNKKILNLKIKKHNIGHKAAYICRLESLTIP